MGDTEAVERLRERDDPFRIVMDDVDRRIDDGGQSMRTHREPSLEGEGDATANGRSIDGSAQQSYALAEMPPAGQVLRHVRAAA